MTFDVDAETELSLRQFKQAMEKQKKRPVTFNEVLKELLGRCETQPQTRKPPRDAATSARHRQKCSITTCKLPSEENHHPTRQAIEKTKITVPLCRPHHQIAHSSRIKNEHKDPQTWITTATPTSNSQSNRIDKKVQAHWQLC